MHALPHIFLCHVATVNPSGPDLFALCSVPREAKGRKGARIATHMFLSRINCQSQRFAASLPCDPNHPPFEGWWRPLCLTLCPSVGCPYEGWWPLCLMLCPPVGCLMLCPSGCRPRSPPASPTKHASTRPPAHPTTTRANSFPRPNGPKTTGRSIFINPERRQLKAKVDLYDSKLQTHLLPRR